MVGWTPEQVENAPLARVYQLEAAYFRELDHERQLAFASSGMVKAEDIPKIYVLSPDNERADRGERIV